VKGKGVQTVFGGGAPENAKGPANMREWRLGPRGGVAASSSRETEKKTPIVGNNEKGGGLQAKRLPT